MGLLVNCMRLTNTVLEDLVNTSDMCTQNLMNRPISHLHVKYTHRTLLNATSHPLPSYMRREQIRIVN